MTVSPNAAGWSGDGTAPDAAEALADIKKTLGAMKKDVAKSAPRPTKFRGDQGRSVGGQSVFAAWTVQAAKSSLHCPRPKRPFSIASHEAGRPVIWLRMLLRGEEGDEEGDGCGCCCGRPSWRSGRRGREGGEEERQRGGDEEWRI